MSDKAIEILELLEEGYSLEEIAEKVHLYLSDIEAFMQEQEMGDN